VRFCTKAADEAYAAIMDDAPIKTPAGQDTLKNLLFRIGDAIQAEDVRRGIHKPEEPHAVQPDKAVHFAGAELEAHAFSAASDAFRICMPALTSRRNAKGYIACVAAAAQRGYFTAPEARAMLYAAQMALSTYPQRIKNPRPAQRKTGFQA